MKNVLAKHYESLLDKNQAQLVEGRDKGNKNSQVDFSLKVKKAGHHYTINCYNTTSRMMINGPEQNTFLGEFAKFEGKILQHPLAEMNKEIKHQLVNYLASIEQGDVPSMHNEQDDNDIVSNVTNSRRSSRKTKRKECYDPSVIPAIQNELPGTKRKICFFCEDSIKPNDMAMECCGCRSWNHVCCDETLTMEFYNQLEDDTSIEYICV